MEKTLRINNIENSCPATNNLSMVFTYVNLLAIQLINNHRSLGATAASIGAVLWRTE
jgi:hypothetical protein